MRPPVRAQRARDFARVSIFESDDGGAVPCPIRRPGARRSGPGCARDTHCGSPACPGFRSQAECWRGAAPKIRNDPMGGTVIRLVRVLALSLIATFAGAGAAFAVDYPVHAVKWI